MPVATAGQDAETKNADRHGHSDRHRREPTGVASNCGVQNRVDEEESAQCFERKRAGIGDAVRIDQRRAEIADRTAERVKQLYPAAIAPASWTTIYGTTRRTGNSPAAARPIVTAGLI